jgi:endonuclease III
MSMKTGNDKSKEYIEKYALKIMDVLDDLYPAADCSLEYTDPFQLLISAQLSAQSTDARVNMVTTGLFKKYKDAADFAKAIPEELEQQIRSIGLYRNKSRNIINCSRMLVEAFNGIVPDEMDKLLLLPGVGRKIANLVLGDGFGIPGIVVDTHTARISNRLGLTDNIRPEKIESDLMKIIPERNWIKFGHQLVQHGRTLCMARKPACRECALNTTCRFCKTQDQIILPL